MCSRLFGLIRASTGNFWSPNEASFTSGYINSHTKKKHAHKTLLSTTQSTFPSMGLGLAVLLEQLEHCKGFDEYGAQKDRCDKGWMRSNIARIWRPASFRPPPVAGTLGQIRALRTQSKLTVANKTHAGDVDLWRGCHILFHAGTSCAEMQKAGKNKADHNCNSSIRSDDCGHIVHSCGAMIQRSCAAGIPCAVHPEKQEIVLMCPILSVFRESTCAEILGQRKRSGTLCQTYCNKAAHYSERCKGPWTWRSTASKRLRQDS